MNRADLIAQRIEKIKKKLGSASLIAVSKFRPFSDIEAAYQTGQRHFGENRVQELKEKAQHFSNQEMAWHFIGHLQTNKINTLFKIPNLKFIHSVDSLKLLQELYKKDELLQNSKVSFFIEIKTSGEEEKMGVESEAELQAMIDLIKVHVHSPLVFCGFMTMGKIRTDNLERDAQECFQKLSDYQKKYGQHFLDRSLLLSMGMSQDWEIAVEAGSDYVRVGTSIFAD